MTPKEAIDYIHGVARFGSKPGLTRVNALLEKMGNPHRRLRYVHVAGTNGKGSTCAMTASVLQAAGFKTGLYTSPYLEVFYERTRINGVMIDPGEFALRVERVKAAVDELLSEGGTQPTQFEIGTALAFEYFADHNCDIVVLEVGLGGRYDSTNCIPAPEVAVITSMSLDHTEYLGNTLTEITDGKCGIIKPDCSVITCAGQPTEALARITSACGELGIALRIPDETALNISGVDMNGCRFLYKGLDINVPLIGAVQVQNALTAIEILLALRERGYNIPDSAILEGMSKTSWMGRFEVIRDKPLCIIDGAHNIDAITRLCETIDSLLPREKRRIVIMGMLRDKDYTAGIAMIARRAGAFIAVSPDSPHALTSAEIAECASPYCGQVETAISPKAAAERALELAGKDDIILGCGSLYLIGDLRKELRQL